MTEQFRVSQRPQMRDQSGPVRHTVQAQPGNYMSAMPSGGEAESLMRGLASLNPALQQYGAVQQQQALAEAEETNRKVALEGTAAAQHVEVPRDALTGDPVLPSNVPPAYADTFLQANREALAHRVGVANKRDLAVEFNNLRNTAEGVPPGWLMQKRQEALKGITDPRAVALIGSHFSELEAQVNGELERDRMVKREESVNANLTQQAADMFTPNQTPDQMWANYPKFRGNVLANGKTHKEAAQLMFMQLHHASNQMGGAPELFDVFEQKDSEGMTLRARNPQLAQAIDTAKQHARQTRDKELMQKSEKSQAEFLMTYESDIDTVPEKVTMERIVSDMTQFGAVQSPGQAASLWARAQDSLRRKAATGQLMGAFDTGELWQHKPEVQNQIMDARMGELIEGLKISNREGNVAGVSDIAGRIMHLQSKAQSTVPFGQLQRYIKTLVTNHPGENASTSFKAAAVLYKAMSVSPEYRNDYFDEDTRKVLEGYVSATGNGTDEKAAYVQAYKAIDPAARKAAEDFVKTPEFQKVLKNDVVKNIEGSSWWPRWLGGNGRPESLGAVQSDAAIEIREWRTRNPFASDEDAQTHLQAWTKKNWVVDTTTSNPVKVPAGLGGQGAQEALSAHSKRVAEALKTGSRSDANWSVQYIPQGTEGLYSVVAFNGSSQQALHNVDLRTLLDNERTRKVLSKDELVALGKAREGLKSGSLPPLSMELLAKAEALGAFKPAEVSAYKAASQKQLLERLQTVPRMSLGTPSFDRLQPIERQGMTPDHNLTARTSLELMTSPMLQGHMGYAASLVTMGESVALRAYDDPAHGAGKNIGMGYNLKANEKNVVSDLKRAGVPEERIEGIRDGSVQLTPEQAKRLLMVALPRYEKQTQTVAEAAAPGLWAKMTPAQRAVMIDVAYQVGDPAKFKQAWAALAAGDQETFQKETKVFFTDRSGERKEDTRRNNLRASMLAGLSHWEASVQKYGTLPSSKLQAVALTSQ
ncbi:hypothetical protein [Rhizobacter sp. Root1221]|uniref:hypothetical protein n=1 Tax=Rhizobacter sp. Root1221 TaxID=1736433 RepID=UPI0007020354|nr:hypothetical protein [Rhizobacter sp. Root1221]KQW02211.1 hypothetical protein ASC87_13350 [Rhizobacter sp. Root1221]